MEFPPFDNISKIWAPTKEELKEFCLRNKYVRHMHGDILTEDDLKKIDEKPVEKIEEPGPSRSSSEELPIHTYLYTLIKKDIYYTSEDRPGVHFMEEEAIVLSGMLEREGFLFENDEPGCMVCATERLEKDLLDMMKRQLQLTKIAREYYTKTENEEKYNICANHRVFNPRNCIPRVNGVRQHMPPRPNLVAELMREQNEPTESINNYFSVPNFNITPSPNMLRKQDFHTEVKLIQMRAQSNRDHLDLNHHKQAQASRPILSNFGTQVSNPDQFLPNSMPDLFSVQTSTFFPNETAISNNFPSASNYLNHTVTQHSASNYLPNHTVNQPLTNVLPSRSNGQIAAANYLANNITEQTPSTNLIANRIIAQNFVSNNFPNTLASTTANNYFANNVNGENNVVNLAAQTVVNNNHFPNRALLQNNSNQLSNHIVAQAQATRQALINNAINNIANDMQDQHLIGNRGRKILGKKY